MMIRTCWHTDCCFVRHEAENRKRQPQRYDRIRDGQLSQGPSDHHLSAVEEWQDSSIQGRVRLAVQSRENRSMADGLDD